MLVPLTARAEAETPSKSGDETVARSFVVELSPLAPLAGRWGGSVQWLVAPHHALTASFSYVARRRERRHELDPVHLIG